MVWERKGKVTRVSQASLANEADHVVKERRGRNEDLAPAPVMTAVVGLAPQDFARCGAGRSRSPTSRSQFHWSTCRPLETCVSITVSLILAGFSRHFHFVLICFHSLCHIPESTSAGPFGESYCFFSGWLTLLCQELFATVRTGIFDIPGLIALLDPFDCGFVRFYELHVPSMPSPSRWNMARWMGAALTQGKYFWCLKRSGVKLFMESKKSRGSPWESSYIMLHLCFIQGMVKRFSHLIKRIMQQRPVLNSKRRVLPLFCYITIALPLRCRLLNSSAKERLMATRSRLHPPALVLIPLHCHGWLTAWEVHLHDTWVEMWEFRQMQIDYLD